MDLTQAEIDTIWESLFNPIPESDDEEIILTLIPACECVWCQPVDENNNR